MALTQGNLSSTNPNPNGSSYTYTTHNQNTGDNRFLFVAITMANTVNYSGVTWNGTSMTNINNNNRTGLSQRMAMYYLADPDTGTNDLVVSFSGSQFNPISLHIASFTGANSTIGINGQNGGTSTPHSRTMTGITANSYIFATGTSNTAQSNPYTFDGNNMTTAYNGHNTNKIVEGAWYQETTAGDYAVVTKCDSGNITNDRVEILEFVEPPPTTSRRIFIC